MIRNDILQRLIRLDAVDAPRRIEMGAAGHRRLFPMPP
jgi:hypothetical protein